MARVPRSCRGCGKVLKTQALAGRHERQCPQYHQFVNAIPVGMVDEPPLAGWRRYVKLPTRPRQLNNQNRPPDQDIQPPLPIRNDTDDFMDAAATTRSLSPIAMDIDIPATDDVSPVEIETPLEDLRSRKRSNRGQLPQRFRDMLPTDGDGTDVVPDNTVPPPIPLRFLPLGLLGRVRLRLRQTFRSARTKFGLSRLYLSRPTSVPPGFSPLEGEDTSCAVPGYDSADRSGARTVEEAISPYPNLSTFLYNEWFWRSGNKSQESRREQQRMFKHPQFNLEHVASADFAKLERLVVSQGLIGPDGQPLPGRGWKRSSLHIQVPHGQKRSSPHHPVDPDSCAYEVPNVLHRSLPELITDIFSRPSASGFQFTPFKLLWRRPGDAPLEENVYSEIFASQAFADAHEAVQALPPEPDCDLPRAVASVMLMSDSAHLSDNGRAKIHPLNLAIGNQTFYERRKPQCRSIHPVAYFPELPVASLQAFVREMPGGKARKKTDPLFTHCRRELFQGVLGLVLDEDFWVAYEHGIVVDCADGVRRRLYPRFFTYTADYPEKCLFTTIKDQGKHPCPSDLTATEMLDQMGTTAARQFEAANPRLDSIARRKSVEKARNLIHKKGYSVVSKKVEEHLHEESYVPTKNAFSDPRNKDDVFSLAVPDPMHEGGSGTWLALLQHLIRILHSLPDGEDRVGKLNQRLNAIGPFSNDVVRQLSENVADLTLMKIYEYESVLKNAAPCFEGLFPDPQFDGEVQDLLFTYARWYTLLNLNMHTDSTLQQLDDVTSDVGNMMRRFQVTSAEKFEPQETPAEAARRVRGAQSRGAKNVSSQRRPKTLNLSTYKFHSMGHCVKAIARVGVTPNYTTSQNELSLREPINDYTRTSRKDYEAQIARASSIKTAHFHMRNALERLGAIEPRGTTRSNTVLPPQGTPGAPGGHPVHGHPTASTEVEHTSRNAGSGKVRRDEIFKGNHADRYHLAQLADERVYLRDLTEEKTQDPAFRDFRTKLQSHCLARLVGGVSSTAPTVPPDDRRTLGIHKDRIYPHNLISFNYTTYDVQRAQDLIHVGTPKQHIMLLSDEDDADSHPFWYARVIGVFHVDVTHERLAPDPERLDVLFVRWFGQDPDHAGGWAARRLDRIGFIPDSDADAFGFVDPAIVIRACHLIPGYAHGQTDELLAPSNHRDSEAGDWRYYYVARFADNDMMMRYTNLGIGHVGSCPRHIDTEEPQPIAEVTRTIRRAAESDSDSELEHAEGTQLAAVEEESEDEAPED